MTSPLPPRGWPALRSCLAPAALALAATAAGAQDPFQAGPRWSYAPGAGENAIPRAVVFAGHDGLAWTAWNGAHPAFLARSSFDLQPASSVYRDPVAIGSTGSIGVVAGRAGEVLYALSQVPNPDVLHRSTRVSRYAAASPAAASAFTPIWTHDAGLRVNGPARIATDAAGTAVVLAIWSDATLQVRVERLDPATGQPMSRATLAGASLAELCVSADGSRAALSAGLDLWVLDQDSLPVFHETLANSTSGLALSRDGRRLAVGGRPTLRVLDDAGSGFITTFTIQGGPQEMAARAALSDDGNTLAVGWWNAVTGVDNRFEVWDVATHTRLLNQAQAGQPGGLQNLPEVVRVTPDGKRAALGAWGDGSTGPEVIVFDRVLASIVLTLDLPGSVFALDLDRSGTRVLVGMKGAHANQFATSGEVRSYETGERELAVLNAPRAGGTIELAARRAGASSIVFLDGATSPTPLFVPGVSGTLLLRRVGLAAARKPADSSGRADHAFAIPGDPLSIGTFRHVQAAFRVNGVLSFGPTLLDVLVL